MKYTYFLFIIILISCQSNQNKPNYEVNTVNSDTIIKNNETKLTPVIIAKHTLQNTVSIVMQDKNRQTLALGSGVIIENGKLITNVHVIAGASYGYVQETNSDDKLNIEGYFIIDKNNDLALLSVPDIKPQKKIVININLPKIGEKIYAAGNPQGFSGTFTEGNVSAIRYIENNSIIQISAPISPGSSGGPIVNAFGELVGIAIGGIENGQNLNFAIPAKYVDSLLENSSENLYTLEIPKGLTPAKKKIRNASEFVKIKNVIWYYDCGAYDARSKTENPLVEFSIYNKTSEPIIDVHILIIIYDSNGLPVDYQTVRYSSETIKPGLAKKVKNINSDYGDYLAWMSGREGVVKVSKKKGYKAEFRVLDYQIYSE